MLPAARAQSVWARVESCCPTMPRLSWLSSSELSRHSIRGASTSDWAALRELTGSPPDMGRELLQHESDWLMGEIIPPAASVPVQTVRHRVPPAGRREKCL